MKYIAYIVSWLAVAGLVQAEVPVYRAQQLEVPSAVVLTNTGPVYYGDVRFTANADGSFTLAQAQRRTLALVESATVGVSGGKATVKAKGELTIACVALEEPGLARKGNTFYVVLAETPNDPDAPCMPLVAVTKFTQDVAIDVRGLAAGTYEVNVNGVRTSFTVSEISI